MRKLMVLIIIFSTMTLSACSFLEGANNTVEYVNQATEHITKLSNFAEQAPQMIKDAAINPEAKQELENQLKTLKERIEQFNLISAPAFAKDIHQQLVDKNKVLLEEVNKVVVNGNLTLDKLENSQIVTTINDVTSLINRINSLGL